MYKQLDLRHLKEEGIFIIWVTGGPASGKTSLCARIAKDFSFIHLSIRDLLHNLIEDNMLSKNDDHSTLRKGQLIPNEFVLFVIKQEMAKALEKNPKGFLLDGFPLDITQAVQFEKDIAPVDCILFLVVDEAAMIDRIYLRSKLTTGILENPKIVYKKLTTFKEFENNLNKYYLPKIRDINGNCDEDSVRRKGSMAINDLIITQCTMKVLNCKSR